MPDNLAIRMRPKNINQVIGQKHLVGEGKIIRRMVEANRLSSMILYGPPGIGKTSIASAIAGTTKFAFRTFNATVDSKKRLQEIAEEAKFSGGLVLLLDEIHFAVTKNFAKNMGSVYLPIFYNLPHILAERIFYEYRNEQKLPQKECFKSALSKGTFHSVLGCSCCLL